MDRRKEHWKKRMGKNCRIPSGVDVTCRRHSRCIYKDLVYLLYLATKTVAAAKGAVSYVPGTLHVLWMESVFFNQEWNSIRTVFTIKHLFSRIFVWRLLMLSKRFELNRGRRSEPKAWIFSSTALDCKNAVDCRWTALYIRVFGMDCSPQIWTAPPRLQTTPFLLR